ncbi:MAG: DUF917 domain-containing protein [Acidimicrobiales bacterium]
MRELSHEDALDAVFGGSILACGGGGWVEHGMMMGELATRIGHPSLCSVDELDPGALVVTVTAIGAPASPNWEIRPLDYVRALQLVAAELDRPVAAVMTAQNGSSTTLNGWIQSAVLGVKVLDAAGDVRAHPTGKLGGLGLTDREGYETVQAVAGGNRALCGGVEIVARGQVVTTSDVLRDVCVRAGGFIAAARNPIDLAYVKENAAIGAVSYALSLGSALRQATSDAESVMAAASAVTGGRVVASGAAAVVEPLRTEGGFDHGALGVGDCVLHYLNEYMTVDRGAERIATYPDVIATLSLETGRPVSIAQMSEGREVAIFIVDRSMLPLSSSTRDRFALEEVEKIMGVNLLGDERGGRGGS